MSVLANLRPAISSMAGPLVAALAVTAAVTVVSCHRHEPRGAHAARALTVSVLANPTQVQTTTPAPAVAEKWAIIARWTAPDGTKEARPYAPKGETVYLHTKASCEALLEGEQVQAAINGLKLVLLMKEGEEAMESLQVACEKEVS